MSKQMNKYPAIQSVIRLFAGNMSQDEEQQLAIQRRDDSGFQRDFEMTTAVLAKMQPLENDPDIQALIEESMTLGAARRRFSVSRFALAASVILGAIAVFSSYIAYNGMSSHSSQSVSLYITRVGEQRIVELSDGSAITLNTSTQLLVDISEDKRRVILERGEAYFDIAADATRPFSVEVGSRSVSVLGTEFNIHKSPEKFTLAVVEGSVAVHPSSEKILTDALELDEEVSSQLLTTDIKQYRVQAGWVTDYDLVNNSVKAFKPDDMTHLYSWRNGVLRFTDEPLIKVVQELNRYGGKKILIEDETIMSLPIYAVLRVDRLDSGIAGLEKGYPIKVFHHFDRIVIVGKD